MIRLVVTDVDGTIVGKDEVLHKAMADYVKGLAEKGINYTIATGRVDGLVKEYVDRMDIKLPYVACNGGTIVRQGKILERKTIPLKAVREVIEMADRMEMSVMYSVDGAETAYRLTPYVKEQQEKYGRYMEPSGFTDEQWESLAVDKVIVMAKVRDGSLDAIEALCRKLVPVIGYKRYANKAIDILNPEATKEKGVKNLADRLGVPMSQVLFVGDDLNDVMCLKEAGIGAAVANAQDSAKEAADYVTEKPCFEGVMEAIEKFVVKGETV